MIAASLVIGAHLATQHIGPHSGPLRTSTPGIYARHDSGLTVGAYRNSYGDGSAYAGWTFETADGRFAITVGGVSGYAEAKVMPLVAPSVAFGLAEGFRARIAFLPKPPTPNGASGVHLAIERGF